MLYNVYNKERRIHIMKAFEKIIGYENEKQELFRLCDTLKNGEKYTSLGVSTPKAVLLHGKPGLGKTLMAKALIEESGRECFPCRKTVLTVSLLL